MNRLELHVDQSGFDKNGQLVLFVVKEMFKAVETFHHLSGEVAQLQHFPRTAVANPALRPPKFARCFIRPPSAAQQDCVNLSNQSQRKGKTSFKLLLWKLADLPKLNGQLRSASQMSPLIRHLWDVWIGRCFHSAPTKTAERSHLC